MSGRLLPAAVLLGLLSTPALADGWERGGFGFDGRGFGHDAGWQVVIGVGGRGGAYWNRPPRPYRPFTGPRRDSYYRGYRDGYRSGYRDGSLFSPGLVGGRGYWPRSSTVIEIYDKPRPGKARYYRGLPADGERRVIRYSTARPYEKPVSCFREAWGERGERIRIEMDPRDC